MKYNDLTEYEEFNVEKDFKAQITILCTTYNHKKYIRRALDGFIGQKSDIPFEILIHDDASIDGTSDIVREYAMKYPMIIKAFVAKNNIYYHPNRPRVRNALIKQFASGKYIAFCEGDDFWIDDEKLQRQWDILEKYSECDMCACWGCTFTEDGKNEISQIRPKQQNGILSVDEVILGGGQYLVSAGLFYRKSMIEDEMNFQKESNLDYMMQIRGALRGGIYYLDRKMAAYRRNANGSWTERVLYNPEQLKKQWQLETNMLKVLDEETDGKYHNTIVERLKSYRTFLEQLNEKREEIVERISDSKKVYLWGMGRRGIDFEKFCELEGIELCGVCDISNDRVGSKSGCGNNICSTEDVLGDAEVILASNSFAYEDLKKSSFTGEIVNLQEYMPYG